MSFSRGPHTFQVSTKLFELNRQRLVNELLKNVDQNIKGNYVLLEGGCENTRYNTDADEIAFRQVKIVAVQFPSL
ncbi:unnamed protein product [Meloidogyne enterolobii]|uniref:Uncharacterized protein n=1 Tax=Meloidogyne enterolobii TaxID=390850 RepID=A0ACB1BA35_MELEN